MKSYFDYPFDVSQILRKKRQIRRELLTQADLVQKKIAILGGSTTSEIKDVIELFLLNEGIKPLFYESDYNRYYEDIIFPNPKLAEFKPDLIYIHTSSVNIETYPTLAQDEKEIKILLDNTIDKFKNIWDQIKLDYACPIIQNNFELPFFRVYGNFDAYDIHGRTNFINMLNARLSIEAQQRKELHLNDICYLSSWFGLEKWYDRQLWFSYKYAMSLEAMPLIASSITSIIRCLIGKSKKCLVLDLDNTLWGGVIGDDGMNGIKIGNETPEAEAYLDFQKYINSLKESGVVLAVCSKNEETNALQGFDHPDSILKRSDFSAFYANWQPKHENIVSIAKDLNLGIDSFVFADDNPAEREVVKSQIPAVAVPELSNVVSYITAIERSGFFEPISLSSEDLKRNAFYTENSIRLEAQQKYANYDDFLLSLDMTAVINSFSPVYLDRITQLINKTNQFNLTTKRYTFPEVEEVYKSSEGINLYGRLIDKFGDNGLVSIIIGKRNTDELHIDIWLMSCRVLKRGMEYAMLDELVKKALEKRIKRIIGYYFPTQKNKLVSNFYKEMGFTFLRQHEDGSGELWILEINSEYKFKNNVITISYE